MVNEMNDMSEKPETKHDRVAARERFIKRGWEIAEKYLDELDKAEKIESTDARSGASVVKTLFDAVDRAEESSPDVAFETDLPEIPENLLDEVVARLLGTKRAEVKTRKGRRVEKRAAADRAAGECPP